MAYADVKNHFLQRVAGGYLKPDEEGFYKECYFAGSYAFLKSKKPVRPASKQKIIATFFSQKFLISDIRKSGVKTPELVEGFFIKDAKTGQDHFVVAQEKVDGLYLFCFREYRAIREAFGENFAKKSITQLTAKEKAVLADSMFERNRDMQETLVRAPQQQFTALMKNYILLNERHGVYVVDSNGENAVYSPNKGFHLVDVSANVKDNIDEGGYYTLNERPDYKERVTGKKIIISMLDAFGDINSHAHIINPSQRKLLQQKNGILAEKVLASAKELDVRLASCEVSALDFYVSRFVHENHKKQVMKGFADLATLNQPELARIKK